MRIPLKKRLEKLEKTCALNQKAKSIVVICDPNILNTIDLSEIDAKSIALLPDNGRDLFRGKAAPKGSYLIQ